MRCGTALGEPVSGINQLLVISTVGDLKRAKIIEKLMNKESLSEEEQVDLKSWIDQVMML